MLLLVLSERAWGTAAQAYGREEMREPLPTSGFMNLPLLHQS